MKPEVVNALKKCDTLKQMVEVMEQNYETNEKLGLLAKGQILVGLGKLIDIAKLKPKK